MRRVMFATTGWTDAPRLAFGSGFFGKIRVPVVIAVCERDDGSIWLVDAGYSRQVCEDPPGRLGRLQSRAIAPSLQPGDELASQLQEAGLNPDRVTTILATHLHLDHIGGCADFPNAELITTHDELAMAHRAGPMLGYRFEDLDAVSRMRLVSFKSELVFGFERSFRFDDEITIVDARGHTKGHIAVVIRHGEQVFLHAGDAAYLRENYLDNVISPLARLVVQDKAALLQTYARLRDCEKQPTPPHIILSHDGSSFEHLPKLTPAPLVSP